MNTRIALYFGILIGAISLLLIPANGFGDKLELKDGTQVQGDIKKVEKGQITIAVGSETKTIDVISVKKLEFEIPSLTSGTSDLPLEHFQAGMEAKEMIGHFQAVEEAADTVRKQLSATEKEWASRKSIEPNEVGQWDAAKERFRPALSRYQESLNDLYFHVLGKVDQYNKMAKEADNLYVGVKGALNVGSSLIPKDMAKLPLKKYVPGNWYDTIFYEGYNRGYNEAFEKYSTSFHLPYEPPASPQSESRE